MGTNLQNMCCPARIKVCENLALLNANFCKISFECRICPYLSINNNFCECSYRTHYFFVYILFLQDGQRKDFLTNADKLWTIKRHMNFVKIRRNANFIKTSNMTILQYFRDWIKLHRKLEIYYAVNSIVRFLTIVNYIGEQMA